MKKYFKYMLLAIVIMFSFNLSASALTTCQNDAMGSNTCKGVCSVYGYEDNSSCKNCVDSLCPRGITRAKCFVEAMNAAHCQYSCSSDFFSSSCKTCITGYCNEGTYLDEKSKRDRENDQDCINRVYSGGTGERDCDHWESMGYISAAKCVEDKCGLNAAKTKFPEYYSSNCDSKEYDDKCKDKCPGANCEGCLKQYCNTVNMNKIYDKCVRDQTSNVEHECQAGYAHIPDGQDCFDYLMKKACNLPDDYEIKKPGSNEPHTTVYCEKRFEYEGVKGCETFKYSDPGKYSECMSACNPIDQNETPGDEYIDPENPEPNKGYDIKIDKYDDPYANERVGDNFCDTPEVIRGLKVIGMLLYVAKFFVPAILIGLGIFDIYKTINSGDTTSLTKQVKVLIVRVFVGIIIFFLPTIVRAIFSFNSSYNELEDDSYNCFEAVINPMEVEVAPSDGTPNVGA